jgi:hypothetical protein
VNEEEAWQELERKQRKADEQHTTTEAQVKAMEFINDHANELGIMTLRKAFEIGYRRGVYAETRRQDAKHKS